MEKNPDFSKTIIYKIVPLNESLNFCYIGSSTDLNLRIKNHSSNCKNVNSAAYNRVLYKTIRENGGWSNWELIQLENYPCNNDNEARKREHFYMKNLNANLNCIRAYRTEEEKLEQQKSDYRTEEQLKEKSKKYYHSHKEDCNEKSKIYYNNNKEYFEKKRKEYYALHKEELNAKRNEKNKEMKKFNKDNNIVNISEKINCICGAIILKRCKSRHEKTTSHVNYINKNNTFSNNDLTDISSPC